MSETNVVQEIEVARIMHRDPKTINDSDSINSAVAKMNVSGIRHLVVVSDRGSACGLISQRDIFRYLAESGNRKTAVKNVMSAPIITVDPEMPISEVAKLMRKHKIGCVPVLSSSQKLIGIVTRSDLLEFVGS